MRIADVMDAMSDAGTPWHLRGAVMTYIFGDNCIYGRARDPHTVYTAAMTARVNEAELQRALEQLKGITAQLNRPIEDTRS